MLLPPQTSEPVDENYAHARRRAFLDAIIDRLRRHHHELLPLAEVRARVGVHGQHDRGIQLVPLANIVGSQGRYLDFDRSFLPRTSQTAQRWKNVDRARRDNVELPPVELYKLSDVYFVADGNHRVSVARHAGQVDIQAHVTELDIDVPLTPKLTMADLTHVEEQADFFTWTNLAQVRPAAQIQVTELGGYLELIRHINWQRVCLGAMRGTEVSSEEAVADWYDTVYMPLVSAIRASDVLRAFPNRTETDLYLWVMEHGQELLNRTQGQPRIAGWFAQVVRRIEGVRAWIRHRRNRGQRQN